MRDTYICNDVSILKKVGQTSGCLIDLFMNNLGREKLSCKYQVLPSKDFAVRINNEQIYVSFPNKTILTQKCIGDATVTKLVAYGPNIINNPWMSDSINQLMTKQETGVNMVDIEQNLV